MLLKTSLLALMLFAGLARSQELSLSVSDIVVEPGELVILTLNVDSAISNLRGYTLDLHYDRSHVTLFSISEGAVLLSHAPTFLYWEDEGLGDQSVIQIDHTILGGTSGGEGPGSLLYCTFVADGCGIETFWVDNALFRDMQNMDIAVTVGPGVEHQVCQVPPLHISYILANNVLLEWSRVLNANLFHVHRAPEVDGPYSLVHTTTDTTWIDVTPPANSRRFYYMTVDHD